MSGRGARGSQGPALMRLVGRPLLLAVPCVGLVLGLFALASNNDLSSLRTDGPGIGPGGSARDAGSSTTTTARTTSTITTTGAARLGTGSTTTSAAAGNPGAGTGITGSADGGGAIGAGSDGSGAGVPVGQLDGGSTTTTTAIVGGGGAVASLPRSGSDVTGPVTTITPTTVLSGGSLVSIPGRTVLDGSPATGPDATSPEASGGSSDPNGTGVTASGGSLAGADPSGTTIAGGGTGPTTPDSPTSNLGTRPGDRATSTTAARAGSGGGGIGSALRTIAIVVALAGSAVGVAYLAGTILQAIVDLRHRGDEDDIDDDIDDPLEAIDLQPGSTGWTLERLRAELESEPDPRVAIRRAYSVVESGFGAGGGLARRRTETPLQYLERTLGTIGGNTQPMRTLTGLFLLARYSNRPISEAMRAAAIAAVVELQSSYRQAEGVAA